MSVGVGRKSNLNLPRLAFGWLVGAGMAYFLTGFFAYFYPSTSRFVFLGLSLNVLCAAAVYGMTAELTARLRAGWRTEWPGLLVYLLASLLTLNGLFVSMRYPGLFDSRLLFMDAARQPLYLGLAVLSLPLTYFLLRRSEGWTLPEPLAKFLHANLPGFLLAALFFATYFIFAATVNFPGYRTLDQYFDMDVSAWLARLTAASAGEITDVVRAVHPAVLLFLRPPVWVISLFLHGNRLYAVFVVHALAAAACVFLTWRIVKRASGRTTYALVMASMLGASASHLLLGSMLETYIYSALALLIFVSLLQKEDLRLQTSVPAGVLVFGITVTNLAQAVILYFFKRPRFKVIFNFLLLVVGLTLVLNVTQSWIYPVAKILWPSNVQNERTYQFDLFESSWRMAGRVSLVTRTVFLYGVVAPRPFVLSKELGMNVPNFRTFEITIGEFHVAGYTGLADVAVKLWILILLGALILFAWEFYRNRSPGLALGFILCAGFNLFLHIVYGDDPMLYSPDWVYALVLFLALVFERFADRKWLQVSLLVFLALQMTVNIGLLRQIMEVSAPFYGK